MDENDLDVIELIDPFACRMWECHDRLEEFVNDAACRDVIESFLRDGQKHAVLARPVSGDKRFKYELIYGARRLFAARHLNTKLLARIKAMDDRVAFIEMDVENRLRQDLSPYERGMSYRSWLRRGYFRSQNDLAKVLGLSTAQVSRLMKFSELPTAVVAAFGDPRHIKEAWAGELATRCEDERVKMQMLHVARSIGARKPSWDGKRIYRELLGSSQPGGAARVGGRDQIVKSTSGASLFRISYRHNDVHFVFCRDLVPARTLEEIARGVCSVLDRAPASDGAEPSQLSKRNGAITTSVRLMRTL